MNKTLPFFAGLLFLAAACAGSEDNPLADVHRSLKDSVFVVETSPEDESESLNRISGDIDLGFTLPYQSYQSENQGGVGPFARAAAVDRKEAENRSQSY